MKTSIFVVRTLVGLAFVLLGSDYFFHFLPITPPELKGPAASFMSALFPTGYMDAVKVLEIAGGLLLLTRILVPLGLVILTPVIVNIAFFEIFLTRQPGPGVVLLALAAFLIWGYRAYFSALFTVHAEAASCESCQHLLTPGENGRCAVKAGSVH